MCDETGCDMMESFNRRGWWAVGVVFVVQIRFLLVRISTFQMKYAV